MNRDTEIALLKRCQALLESRTTEVMSSEVTSPIDRYACSRRFAAEMSDIFRKMPLIAAHASELPEPGSYKALEWLEDFPLLLTRDKEGEVHAFANVCKHRGGKLAEDGEGCSRRLVCPYHAWSYDLDGSLKTVPHQKTGFPEFDLAGTRLMELPSAEAFGFIWVQRDGEGSLDIAKHLAGLGTELDHFAPADHVIFDQQVQDWNLNWKILVEGGIESYHFKIAHRNTIAPLFNDNLSIFDEFGPHFRSVLTKKELRDLKTLPEEEWRIRICANVLYSLYPFASVLIQPDHFALVNAIPLAADKTRIILQTLVPKDSLGSDNAKQHWQANFDLTRDTLVEDFLIGEQIQKGISTGANDAFTFGRFEAALARFHDITEERLAAD